MSDRSELKKLAEAATPGPWVKSAPGEVSSAEYEVDGEVMCDHIASSFGCGSSDPDDAAFVAAANPASILNLIAEIDDLAAQRDEGLAREAELQSQLAKQGEAYCKRVDELITLQQRLTEAKKHLSLMVEEAESLRGDVDSAWAYAGSTGDGEQPSSEWIAAKAFLAASDCKNE